MSDEERDGFEGVYPDDEEEDDLDDLGMHEEGVGDDEEAPAEEDEETV